MTQRVGFGHLYDAKMIHNYDRGVSPTTSFAMWALFCRYTEVINSEGESSVDPRPCFNADYYYSVIIC